MLLEKIRGHILLLNNNYKNNMINLLFKENKIDIRNFFNKFTF